MDTKILLHQAIIEIIILIILIAIYYITKDLIPDTDKVICLLGTYSLLHFVFGIIHYVYHKKINH